MINRTVLMSSIQYFNDDQPINPFMTQQSPINLTIANQEHSAIRSALESAGVRVTQLPAPENCQDGVFTANWALVRGDKAVMAHLPNARRAEEPYAKQALEKLGKTVSVLPNHLKFSGQGDALACGPYLFCGSQYRSDDEAQTMVAEILGYERIQLQTVPLRDDTGKAVINAASGLPDSFYYDLDLALSIIQAPSDTTNGLIAWCSDAFTPDSQKRIREFTGVDKIEVSENEALEALACNLVSTGSTVIMNANAPMLTAALEAHGLKVVTVSNPELAKGGGSVRCTTLTLD